MKQSTFRSLSIGDKVQPINRDKAYVTCIYTKVVNGEPKSYIEVAGEPISEDFAWLLSPEVEHPAPMIYN